MNPDASTIEWTARVRPDEIAEIDAVRERGSDADGVSSLSEHTYLAARATGAYERKLASLARVTLLIIDDFGLKPLRPPADEDLHDLIAERYEQTATIVTSNLDFPEWDQAFPANRLLASATLDRLRHNAYCLTLDGASFRAPRALPETTKPVVAKRTKQSHP